MAQSTFKAINTVTIDRITPSYNGKNLFRDGALILGASKASDRNVVHTFDLLSPDDGLPLDATSQISLAELLGNVTAVIGGPYNMLAERLTRADYDYLTATWTEYKTGSAWTTPGGDFSSMPAGIDVPFPAFIGDGVICATLAPFVVDALANRGGKLYLHWRLDPVGPQQSQQVTLKVTPAMDSDVVRLRVTYTSLQPAVEDRPQGAMLHGQHAASPARGARVAAPAPAAPVKAPPSRTLDSRPSVPPRSHHRALAGQKPKSAKRIHCQRGCLRVKEGKTHGGEHHRDPRQRPQGSARRGQQQLSLDRRRTGPPHRARRRRVQRG